MLSLRAGSREAFCQRGKGQAEDPGMPAFGRTRSFRDESGKVRNRRNFAIAERSGHGIFARPRLRPRRRHIGACEKCYRPSSAAESCRAATEGARITSLLYAEIDTRP